MTTARLAGAEYTRNSDLQRVRQLYGEALEGLQRTVHPVQWARIANRAAVVYADTDDTDSADTDANKIQEQLLAAIALYDQALEIFRAQRSDFDTAAAEHNRALAAWRLAVVRSEREWFEQARAGLPRACELRAADEVPGDWAASTMVLAELEVAAGRPDVAVPLFRAALEVLRAGGESRLVLRCAAGLGDVYGDCGDWVQARETFDIALRAADELVDAAVIRSSKERMLGRASGVAVRAAYAYAKVGELAGAQQVLERGRARLLAEAMDRRDDRFDTLALTHPVEYAHYEAAARALEVAEAAALRLAETSDPGADQRYHRRAEAQVRTALMEARAAFAATSATLTAISSDEDAGAPMTGTLAYLLTTRWGSLSLLCRPGGCTPVWAPHYTETDLLHALRGRDGDTGLLTAIHAGPSRIDDVLEWVLPRLGSALLEPLAAQLREGEGITVVACGGLTQMPLHAAPVTGGLLGDQFVVSYAPRVRCSRPAAVRSGGFGSRGHSRSAIHSATCASRPASQPGCLSACPAKR